MTEEAYVPLRKSPFWEDMKDSVEKYWRTHPTMLDHLCDLSFGYGDGCDWMEGRLVDGYEPHTETKYDLPHQHSGVAKREAPEKNPLFDLIPEIPKDQFLRHLSPGFLLEDTYEQRVVLERTCRIDKEYSHFALMPSNIDIHYLAASMMMLKHVHLHPESTADDGKYGQIAAVKKALKMGFDIIRQRGLEESFAKSCAEFQRELPVLTAFQEKYIADHKKQFQEGKARRQPSLGKKFNKPATAEVEARMKELRKELEELFKKPDGSKKPPAPKKP